MSRVQVAAPVLTSGAPMAPSVRHRMESSFNRDFSDVRIHEDHSARLIGAVAYTSGRDIHFSPGTYNPHSAEGHTLLAHELTHVVQQAEGGGGGLAQGLVEVPVSESTGGTAAAAAGE